MKCESCDWWKKDWGTFCVNGWTGSDRKDGHCHRGPTVIYKAADDFCSLHSSINTSTVAAEEKE